MAQLHSSSENISLVYHNERVVESEYLETPWRLRIIRLRKRLMNLLREKAKKFRMRKEYTRFLTDDEKRLRIFLLFCFLLVMQIREMFLILVFFSYFV